MTELTGSGAITPEYLAEVEEMKPVIEYRLRNAKLAQKAQEEASMKARS